MNPFFGGFFEHRQWYLRTDLEKQSSIRSVTEYEKNYINASGYWMVMKESVISLKKKVIDEKEDEVELRFDVWVQVFVRYALRVVDLQTELYKFAPKDPTYAKDSATVVGKEE